MRKQILIVVSLFLVLVLPAVSAHAQASAVLLARIPFNFTVSGKTLAAGDYAMMLQPHQLTIEDDERKIVARVLVNDSGNSADKKGQLIFHCYEDRCFLAEVWPASSHERGCEVLTSRAEAALAKHRPGQYFAVLGSKPGK